jgi:oxaloacetate decarboxylase alpha subunit
MNNTEPIKIVDLTLRDGHQSLAATRMHTGDMIPVLDQMDDIGFYALEVWGGATFDSCLRFLNEDPWQRLRDIRRHVKKTKLMMLLRGQNILGYTHYADDVVREFVFRSVANGIDIIRIFDAFNDVRNLETAMKATKEAGAHAQGTFVYTISPYHKDSDFVKIAKDLVNMGADSICIKDMSGLLSPYAAYDLVTALKAEIKIPIEIHSHCTSGMGSMTILKAIEAGVDIVDTCMSPFAMSTSHTCTESLVDTLTGRPRDPHIDVNKLYPIADHFKQVKTSIEHYFNLNTNFGINPQVLSFQIPGGMLSNLRKQLSEQGMADKYEDLLKEMPKVRADLGYPPLVTPSSQIVGSMAALNVMLGRYKMIPKEVKDIVRGKYGRTPGPISEELKAKILVNGEKAIDHRPADDIPPQLEKMKQALASKGYPNASIEDVLSYALFPEVALAFFQKNRSK